jgi:hypothetical protein
VRKVVFAWDSPPARVDHPETLAAFGGFFFRRADYPVEVVPVQLFPGQDPNRALLQAAEPGGAAILWVYDTKVDGTLATSFPPRIDRLDPRWRCDQTGGDGVGVVTCIPPMARPAG